MKALFIALVSLIGLGHASSGSITFSKSLAAVDSAITVDSRGYGSVSFQLTGTWSATVKFEGTVNATTWTTVYAVNQNGGAVDSVASANGVYLLSGNGFAFIRARVSAYTSGTVVIQTRTNEESGVVSLLNQTAGGGGGGDASAANQVTGNASLANIEASTGIMDDWDESDRAKVNLIVGQAGIAAGTGNAGATVPRVVLATDQPALANLGAGSGGSAAPTNMMQAGARSGANMVAVIQASSSVKIDVSTATTTQLVALASSQKIYVTSWDVVAAGTGTIKLVYGTGTNCGTGTTDLTGAYSLVAQAGIAKGNGLGPVLVVPSGNALCVTTSAAVGMQGSVAYTQF